MYILISYIYIFRFDIFFGDDYCWVLYIFFAVFILSFFSWVNIFFNFSEFFRLIGYLFSNVRDKYIFLFYKCHDYILFFYFNFVLMINIGLYMFSFFLN